MSFKSKLATGLFVSISLLGANGAIANANIPDAARIKPITYGNVVEKEIDVDWKNPKVKFD